MRPVKEADIVRSLAGRDAGGLFFVLRVEGDFAFLADGRLRRRDKPKKKRLRHLRFVSEGGEAAAAKLMRGEIPTNRELKTAISALGSGYRDAGETRLSCSLKPQNVEEGS